MKFFFLMVACLTCASAAANEPAAAAIEFLEKIRAKKVDLTPGKDTAVSPFTAIEKRREISRRLEKMSDDLGKGTLQPGEIKIDNDLAAVLVRNTGGFDPSRMRVFAVGLVKVKDEWRAAPLPASFENTGLGWLTGMRDRMAALESWMMRGQVTDLEQLRDQSTEKMRQEIAAAFDPSILRTGTLEEITNKFLAACQKRDLPAILGFLGGLQQKLPDDWQDRLRSADAAVSAGKDVGWPWRLVMAPEVLRVRVEGRKKQTELISFACLDPAGGGIRPSFPNVEILHLEFSKNGEGLWKVDLPGGFLLSPGDEEEDSENDFEIELMQAFPSAIRKQMPAKPAPTLKQAAADLEKAFAEKNLLPLISMMDLDGDPGAASRGCGRAAQSWWLLHHPGRPRYAVPLEFHEIEKTGIVSFQFFSPREPERLDVKSFYFEKTPAGWLLMPGLQPTNSPNESEIAAKEWAKNQAVGWRQNWQTTLLGNSEKLESIQSGNAPSADEARKLVETWLQCLQDGNISKALPLTVWMNRPGGAARVLQNLGYELGSALQKNHQSSVKAVLRGETWTTVAVESQTDGATVFPIYLVVATHAGPRILIETDLFAKASSGRELLNASALRRAKEFSDPKAAEELSALFSKIQENVAK